MFGKSLRTHRHQSGLSQEDLARRAKLDVKTVRNIEHGHAVPRPSTVRQLADALGLTGANRERFCVAAAPGHTDSLPHPVPNAPRTVPAQLPLAVHGFVGREAHLEALDASAERARQLTEMVISMIHGAAGVGKTALAVHWAQRVADQFDDGQLYVNLRGFAPTGTPMPATEAIRAFLDALDVPPQRIPTGLDAQAALYRSLLVSKRMLIVLDNARDVDQVRPLLPGAAGCLVLVTSRTQLTGLVAAEGARPISLDALAADEAGDLLTRRLGAERVAAEPEPAQSITTACGRLPLALVIVAARAATHPQLPLRTLADELSDTASRLDSLSTSDPVTDIRSVFSWSYHALSAQAARLFRLLGLHPGPDTSVTAAASLAALPVARVSALLTELTQANLIVEHTPGRYALHDLLRTYATELAHHVDPDERRRAATHRLLDHYLHTAHTADLLLSRARDPITLALPQPGVTVDHPADQRQALAWFTTERRGLLATFDHAAATGFDTHNWQLAWILWTFLERQGHWHDLAAAGSAAVTAARQLADPAAQARAHLTLAGVHTRYLDRIDDAHTNLRHALDLSTKAGDPALEAHTHFNLSLVRERQGRHTEALHHARQALGLFQAAGHRWGHARAVNRTGWCHVLLGDHQQALTACRQSLTLHQELDDRIGQAKAWDSLGSAHHHLGHHTRASTCYQRALALFRVLGDHYHEADALTHLGDTHHAAGNFTTARDFWQRALTILTGLNHPDAKTVHAKLALAPEP
ncbi:MAG TPA: tetratricopeptide repeat protein [Amycolatopsis sp.]|uniref:ATP-binding protein n=1 Tax=Amycolatopsis sp. TaxID=37632 RepID=UPI002B4649FD|nr:tetratricopeptide repeat protein [Amycolatopsis sp.]HKS48954.1 tetratricopeptide repeat protein [Amycolatopsis sp.]